ncbi:MAG: type I polyketide synthase [Anaerolineales bacterium]|nr:type I polyketide synthase [Anaerolineales bacterium]
MTLANRSAERGAPLSAKQQAVLALQAAGARRAGPPLHEPIAIIGLACRFPGGGDTPEAFWDFLRRGGDAVEEVPPDRWPLADYYNPDPGAPGKMTSRWGAFLPEVDRFDARFFGLAPREVANMDPQQRLLLEVAWEALERAGLVPASLDRTPTGVFVGISTADYARLGFAAGDLHRIDAYYGTGNSFSVAAGRLAYLLGAQGPVFALDTACSSSLVALHQAVQSLRARECALALVGGVNLMLIPDTTVYFSKLQALSPDGRCKAFDASANGYVRGEGAGVVVLKRLSAAIRDGDPIAAVIRGTAINHDGPSSGLTVPNGPAQQAVIRAALRDGNVDPAHIGYLEAHGTGTPLGDPIEMHALAAVFGEAAAPLYVGSVKSNLGHTEAAAGMAGLVKAILALQHHAIPPHLHFREPSPRIEWTQLGPLQVPTALAAWPAPAGGPRFAGVSSFGFSGTNAHVVVEEAPPVAPAEVSAPPAVLLPLSARTPAALRRQARRFAAALAEHAGWPPAEVAYTAARRRAHYEHRLAVVGASPAALAEQLAAFSLGEAIEGLAAGSPLPQRDQRVVFVFTGQGPEWAGMGRELYAHGPAFRAVMAECDAVISRLAGWSLLDYLQDRPGARSFDGVNVIHPLLFAMQVGLARQWQAWGLRPAAVVGQSLGELAALCVAGSLSLPEALGLMIARSRLIHQLRGQGRMAMVGLSAAAAQAKFAAVSEPLYVAVERSSDSVIVAGPPAAVDAFVAQQTAAGVFCRVVVDDVATHCPIADPIVDELGQAAAGVVARPATVAYYSTVTASAFPPEQVDAAYWQRNLREPVRWQATVQALLADGYQVFVEVSPHPTLLATIEQIAQRAGQVAVTAGSTARGRPELPALLMNVARLYVAGLAPDWAALYPAGRVVPLPTYAWDRERHWFENAPVPQVERPAAAQAGPAALRGSRLASPLETAQFAATFSAARLPYLTDHRVSGVMVVAGAAHLAQLLEVARAVLAERPVTVRNVSFLEPMLMGEAEALSVQTLLAPNGGRYAAQLFSRPAAAPDADPWALHVTALLEAVRAAADTETFTDAPAEAVPLPLDAYHAALDGQPYQLTGSFRRLAALWRAADGALVGRFRPPADADEQAGYRLHPGLLDSCFQAIGAAAYFDVAIAALGPGEVYVPIALGALDWLGGAEPLWCRATVRAADAGETLTGEVQVYDVAGALLARLSGLQVRRVAASRLTGARGLALARWLYEMQWQSQALNLPPLPTRGQWLLLAAGPGLAEAVAAELRTRGGYPILAHVEAADRPPNGAGALTVANTPDGCRRWLAETLVAYPDLRGVLYCADVDHAADSLPAAAEANSLPALYLAQALAALPRPPRLWLITRGAVAVSASAALSGVGQAPLWGLGRVLQTEAAELRAALVDVAGPGDAKALVDELLSGSAANQVALRGGQRFVARLAPLALGARPAPAIQPHAAYAITGGFGGLGLAVARWLVEQGARHLLLIGRRPPAPEAAAALDQLRAAGAEVRAELADVAERAELARALSALDHLPPLAGVVHAAGTLDDALLPNMDSDRFRRVLRAKLAGGWHLHELTRERPLDFFVLFSSVAAVFGSPGQSNHAAASAFLDGLAAHRRGLGLPGVSISWGPWVGLGAAAGKLSAERVMAGGVAPITPDVGLALFAHCLAGTAAQPIAMAVDWPRWFQAFPTTAAAPYLADLAQRHAAAAAGGAPGGAVAAQLAALAAGPERRDFLLAFLTRQIAQVLRLPPSQLDPHTPFGSLGFDSLMAVEVKTNLERQLGLVLPVSLVWNYPTLAELAGYLAGELGVSLDEAAPSAAAPEAAADALAGLSEADLEALLAAQVARANKTL